MSPDRYAKRAAKGLLARTKQGRRRKRSPNLGNAAVSKIVAVLGNWSGKLTWELLLARVYKELGATYTRQSLAGHDSIALAFRKRKRIEPEDGGDFPESPELKAALAKIVSLEVEVERLNAVVSGYKEERVRWIYNASIRNLTEPQLNQEIPAVDRRQTRRADDKARRS